MKHINKLKPELIDYYNEYFRYENETGKLFLKKKRNGSKSEVGDEVGYKSSKRRNYKTIRIQGNYILLHRLIWFCETGEQPNIIDHINGIEDDNRLCNLRNTSQQKNCTNKKKYKNNKSGYVGVFYNKENEKWRVIIKVDKKQKHIGYFLTIEEAIEARKKAEIEYGYHENHGR